MSKDAVDIAAGDMTLSPFDEAARDRLVLLDDNRVVVRVPGVPLTDAWTATTDERTGALISVRRADCGLGCRCAGEVKLTPTTTGNEWETQLMTLDERDPREVVAEIEQAIEDGNVVTCRECSEELPTDERCPATEDGLHDPDQVTWDPEEGEPETRTLVLELRADVPNDGYDYGTDVTGRLEHLLTLMLLHPLVSRAGTGGPTGSGYVRDDTEAGGGA